jgi:transcription antitermination factor NusG
MPAPLEAAPERRGGQPDWSAIYTCSRQEKKVAEQLQLRKIECFLPLFSCERNWGGRRARVELPLFPGYVFVRPELSEVLRVLNLPGVVRMVSFGGKPARITTREIEGIRTAVTHGGVEPWPWLAAGRRVRIKTGALAGLEGVVVRRKNRLRVVIALEVIMRAMSVEVDGGELEPLASSPVAGRSSAIL